MLEAEMRANYFGALVLRYQRREKWFRVITLVASSGAAVTAIGSAPPWLRLLLPVSAAVAGFWLLFSQYGTLSIDAANLHDGWNAVHTQYERLWCNLDSPDAELRFYETCEGANGLSKAGTKFPNDKKRLGLLLDHAARMATARYA
jgi:hypothetical protein